MEKHSTNYQQALDELRGILEELNQNQVSMDELPKKVARAKELLQYCRKQLRHTEMEISSLLDSEL